MKASLIKLFATAVFPMMFSSVVLLAPVACGSTSSTMAKSRAAQYQISPADLLDIAVQIVKDKYQIQTTAPDGFITEGKWYNAQGASETRGGEAVNIQDGSINVAIMVQVFRTDNGFSSISVKTIAKKHISGMSALEPYDDEDISKPGWIDGKAEVLAEEIAAAAKKYEATGKAPPPQAPPAPPM